MKTNILKGAFISILAVVLFIAGCEEEQNALPEYTVYLSPGEDVGATQGDVVQIKVIASDSDGEIQQVELYIDDELIQTENATRLVYDWETEFIEPKDYTIKTIVTDNEAGQSSNEIVYTIHGSNPIVEFSYSDTIFYLGTEVTFTDESSYEPTSWLWNFGDGNTSTEQNPTYTYKEAGTFTVKLTATNAYGSSDLLKEDIIEVKDTICKDYDNNIYKVVKIGEQYWMAENLKTTHYADGTPLVDGTGVGSIEGDYTTKYYFAYDDDESNVETYGRLYTWAAVMNGAESSNENPSGVQGVCPDNWHVPSKAEWNEMINYLGGTEIAGGKLKATGYDYWNYPNAGASNESGFSALPGGQRGFSVYSHLESEAYFQTVTKYFSLYVVRIFHNNFNVEITNITYTENGRSVRCVRD